jgi:hypothetical protein
MAGETMPAIPSLGLLTAAKQAVRSANYRIEDNDCRIRKVTRIYVLPRQPLLRTKKCGYEDELADGNL